MLTPTCFSHLPPPFFEDPFTSTTDLHKQLSSSTAQDVLACKKAPTPAKKDYRQRKIMTNQGLRDRRVRLSIDISHKFFHLQDMLGFDKASKTIDWLLHQSRKSITKLISSSHQQINKNELLLVGEEAKLKQKCGKESRYSKARERARERTKEKKRSMLLPNLLVSQLQPHNCDKLIINSTQNMPNQIPTSVKGKWVSLPLATSIIPQSFVVPKQVISYSSGSSSSTNSSYFPNINPPQSWVDPSFPTNQSIEQAKPWEMSTMSCSTSMHHQY